MSFETMELKESPNNSLEVKESIKSAIDFLGIISPEKEIIEGILLSENYDLGEAASRILSNSEFKLNQENSIIIGEEMVKACGKIMEINPELSNGEARIRIEEAVSKIIDDSIKVNIAISNLKIAKKAAYIASAIRPQGEEDFEYANLKVNGPRVDF